LIAPSNCLTKTSASSFLLPSHYAIYLIIEGSALANTLHLSPETMAEVWEAFSLNKNITELTDHSWKSFRTELQKEADRNPNAQQHTPMEEDVNIKQEGAVAVRGGLGKRQVGSPNTAGTALVTPPTKRMARGAAAAANAANNNHNNSAVDALLSAKTAPTPNKVTSSLATTTTTTTYTPPKYDERTGAGKVVLTLNPNDLPAATAEETTATSAKCSISHQHFDTNVQKPYRHLFTTIEERAKHLDQQLEGLEKVLMQRFKIMAKKDSIYNPDNLIAGNLDKDGDAVMTQPTTETSEHDTDVAPLEAVGIPRQEKISCIGRICNSVSTHCTYRMSGCMHNVCRDHHKVPRAHVTQKIKISYLLSTFAFAGA